MEKKDEPKPYVPKSAMDFQRLKLERLMANPEKPVIIPEPSKDKKGFNVPEFVRNVMGSSAGAGSGEFHVYRHLRRKEYTRQKIIDEMGVKERLDYEHFQRMEENKRKLEEKTSKKRAKRLKRKQNAKMKKSKKDETVNSDAHESESESDSEETSEKEDSENKQSEPEKDLQNLSSESSESSPKESKVSGET